MAQDYRAQIAVWHDSLAPTDACCINPTFRNTLPGPHDTDGMAQDLAVGVLGWLGQATQVRVRIYKLPLVKPIAPVSEKTVSAGVVAAATKNREVALTLSFYAGVNQKRRRGRLYIPAFWRGIDPGLLRPTTANMNDILNRASLFTGLGGVDVDWTVYSEVDGVSRPVTNTWVDNEWDTQRSRGLKPTTRVTGTTTEGDLPNVVALQAGAELDQLPASSTG
jgi:hypothetical protein